MNVVQELGVDVLKLRGLNEEYNGFGRFFRSITDARAAVESGDYDPIEGNLNAVIVGGSGIMVWSFDLQDFVLVSDLSAAGNQAEKFIELDGVNDYIEFTGLTNGAADVLDFTKDWSIGVTLVGVTGPSSAKKMTLFGRGGCTSRINKLGAICDLR